ncbi:GNAT family N-acetyltransferase [Breznakiella homolactica]|uniref:GNAT family N-acetyltransferase n=1 Tax=Breznakiella homolactica TaxID=2798577 RepID=A0A7T7XQH9_9SPIR|nr:GNAT family N-acetyltransferase [Breznakiella homolactica]QQO10628.1 GNAT family N-acetyltransferase [Breznakiella homolactica]
MEIMQAENGDLAEILELQYRAFQSEAELAGDYAIPPLLQTLPEFEAEFRRGIVLKAVDESGQIIGSVRAYAENGTLYIGKLIVHPDFQGRGTGTRLLAAIETRCPQPRYELFTGDKSAGNLRLYEKQGYRPFAEKEIKPGLRFIYLEKNAGTGAAPVRDPTSGQ